jgi:hypothetical protein
MGFRFCQLWSLVLGLWSSLWPWRLVDLIAQRLKDQRPSDHLTTNY